jgi:diadenosine tetraphosphatase ApaH/serine/threonine PP2A family protein phosphatase
MALSFRSGVLVNPGSVGQPRDGDPRASWGLLDLTRRAFGVRRVPYDIDAVATSIRRAGLPTELADRLYAGV